MKTSKRADKLTRGFVNKFSPPQLLNFVRATTLQSEGRNLQHLWSCRRAENDAGGGRIGKM